MTGWRLEVDLEQLTVVVDQTGKWMTRIWYQDSDATRRFVGADATKQR